MDTGTIQSERQKDVSSIRLFSQLPSSELDVLTQHAQPVQLKKHELIIKRGDYLSGMYGLISGRLKIYLLSCSGHERILRIVEPGDAFGEVIMFNNIPSPVHVEAMNNSELLYFPKEQVTELLAKNPNFTMVMLNAMGMMLKELIEDLETTCLHSALQRIAYFLIEHADDDEKQFILPSTKAVTASMLSMTAESFSRGLHQLSDQGIIGINRREINIHEPDQLRDIAFGKTSVTTTRH